jgi:hypothetical protein
MPELTTSIAATSCSCKAGKIDSGFADSEASEGGVDDSPKRLKAPATMKHFSSKIVASLLAIAVTASAALASANPQCGDDKKDDKSGETKPKAPSAH